MLRTLAPFVRHIKGKQRPMAALFFLGLAGAGVSLATPLIGKNFIDAVTERGDFSMVPVIAAALVGISILDLVIGYITRMVHARLSADVLVAMRERMFFHCLSAPIEDIERFRHGDLLSRFGSDLPRIQSLLVDGAIGFLHNVLFLTVAAIILIYLSPPLALWSFVGLAIALVITALYRGPVERGTRGIREKMADLSHFFSERLGALRAVRMYGAVGEDALSLGKLNRDLVGRVLRFQSTELFASRLPGLAISLSLAWIYLVGGGLLESEAITLGSFVAFILYQGRLYGPASGLLGLVRTLQEVRVSIERISEVLGAEEEVGQYVEAGEDSVEAFTFDDVSFSYKQPDTEGELVLDGVNLTIKPGEKVALFGPSGTGKSTLVQLIFGLRKPAEGKIRIGGMQGRPKSDIHEVVGYSNAEPFLLHATVEENLRYGNPNVSAEELVDAARLVEAHGFILCLPQGFETVIGGRGLKLSDGQRQRLGLARMIVKNPNIMVLDEAFSALDPETEARVRRNLWSAFAESAMLVISHRLTGLEQYDKLLLLDAGKIRPVSSDELCEFYRHIEAGEPVQTADGALRQFQSKYG